ncbi:MAG: copper chaperone PCu(A)C [Alphaproteobacteria bacterium]
MARFLAWFLAGFVLLGGPMSRAHEYQIGSLTIDHPWARATAGSARNGAAYLVVVNRASLADWLIGAESEAAERIEFHVNETVNGVISMHAVEAVELPRDVPVVFEPGGLHLMLKGLTRPLKQGETFDLTLRFRKAGPVVVEVVVGAIGAAAPAHGIGAE